MTPEYTLDGEPVDIEDFLRDISLEPEMAGEAEAILNLEPGEEHRVGGGAVATFVVRRTA